MPAPARQDTASKFVVTSLERIDLGPGARILDISCGFGRHSRWLAANGALVVGLDVSENRISQAFTLSGGHAAQIMWVVADAKRSLPLLDSSFDVVVIVHYFADNVIEMARRALKPEGYLIFETYDARGENWRQLPRMGTIPTALTNGFEIVYIHERAVGPNSSRAVVRALARALPLRKCDPIAMATVGRA